MNLNQVKFEYFRSFGTFPTKIKIDPEITFFVGKNHTGKSNLFKLLHELKKNNIPQNKKYILDSANWFNYEAGVDRPLKIRFKCGLSDDNFLFFCHQWLISPIKEALVKFKKNSNSNPNSSIASYNTLINQCAQIEGDNEFFKDIFPNLNCIIRLEFIRFSESLQSLNYSIEFNKIIAVNTADGRKFVQNIGFPNYSKFKEEITWQDHIIQTIELQKDNLIKGHSPINLKSIIRQVFNSGEKFIMINSGIDELIHKFLSNISFYHSSQSVDDEKYEPSSTSNLQSFNILLASKLQQHYRYVTPNGALWYKLIDLMSNFESIYESLDLTFGISTRSGNPEIQYYIKNQNRIIYNFDSIGLGITSMLNLLYQLIIEENLVIALDSPEYQLHPHSQRNLYNLIKEYSIKNHHQIIIITHSPYFMHPKDIFQLRLFNISNGLSTISQVEVPQNEKYYHKLMRNFSIRNRDAIFADGLIFIEGPSEEWAFPYFFNTFGFDLDLYNLSLINLHGKGNFEIYWQFAKQLNKNFWFFFDNDFLGVKAGEEITYDLFLRSILYKNRRILPPKIQHIIHGIVYSESPSGIEFHEELEHLRHVLEECHIFVIKDDFEGIFESALRGKVDFYGGKVEKSIQLINYLQASNEISSIPNDLYRYIELIKEELFPTFKKSRKKTIV